MNKQIDLPIYVINLPTSVDRRDAVQERLKKSGLRFEFVDAVRGTDVSENELRSRFVHYDEMTLGRGEFGCALSHVKCWEKLLASTNDAAIICEDDIYFSNNFTVCINDLIVPLKENCLIRFETMLATVTAIRKPVQKERSFSVLRILTTHAGAACYLINRPTAEILVSSYKNIRHMLDNEMFSPDCHGLPPLAIYQVFPAPCIQHNILFPDQQLGSDIGFDREDAKLGYAPYRQPGWEEGIKNLLRPLYRKLYSFFLMFDGKRRVKIRYE